MKKILLLLISAVLIVSCSKTPASIPSGQWSYKILMNGTEVGSADISNKMENDRYVNVVDMKMQAGEILNTTKQVVIETMDFKPVKLEIHNKIFTGNSTENIDTVAVFEGQQVTLTADKTTSSFTISRPFVLEGNAITSELIKAGFRDGTEIVLSVYEPSIELEEPITIKTRVVGREKVDINGVPKDLIHITHQIENMKNIDSYIDDRGITQKEVITMLNSRLELVIK
jgi:hypothetical protein